MGKKFREDAAQRYEEMDPEERKYEARRRIRRMVFIRLVLAGLLVWTIIVNRMPTAMVLLLVGVIVLILGTLIPVLKTFKNELKYEDE